jgi:hypothetical protein
MVYWITGKAKAGKTTFAKVLASHVRQKPVILDGDDVRLFFKCGFSDNERYEHIMRIARIGALLEKQSFIIIVALVSPKKVWRQEARSLFRTSKLIFIPGGELWPGTEYEEPDSDENPIVVINTKLDGRFCAHGVYADALRIVFGGPNKW